MNSAKLIGTHTAATMPATPPPSNSNGRIVRSPDWIIETKGWRCGEASGQRGIAVTPRQMKLHSTCIGITLMHGSPCPWKCVGMVI